MHPPEGAAHLRRADDALITALARADRRKQFFGAGSLPTAPLNKSCEGLTS